jgi:hypothetical protein
LIREFINQAGLGDEDPKCALEEVLEILSYGSGPVVRIKGGKHNLGFGDYQNSDRFITISKKFMRELKKGDSFENKTNKDPLTRDRFNVALKIAVFFTLWHEGIHYEDFWSDNCTDPHVDGVLDNGDYGEVSVLGFDIVNVKRIVDQLIEGDKNGGNFNTQNVKKWFQDIITLPGRDQPYNLIPGKYVFRTGIQNNPSLGVSPESAKNAAEKVGDFIQKVGEFLHDLFTGSEDAGHWNVRYFEE